MDDPAGFAATAFFTGAMLIGAGVLVLWVARH